jgi:hypothetical protein
MPERRRVRRHAFGGVAEITAFHPDTFIVVPTAELSRNGCFVTTNASIPVGTKVSIRITNEDKVFNASGEVVYVSPESGMGIRFITTAPEDVAVLEAWLRQ